MSVVFVAFGIDFWKQMVKKQCTKTCKFSMHHSKQSIEKSMQNWLSKLPKQKTMISWKSTFFHRKNTIFKVWASKKFTQNSQMEHIGNYIDFTWNLQANSAKTKTTLKSPEHIEKWPQEHPKMHIKLLKNLKISVKIMSRRHLGGVSRRPEPLEACRLVSSRLLVASHGASWRLGRPGHPGVVPAAGRRGSPR